MGAIYKKEIRSYFNSMIGWIFLAFMIGFIGLFFYLTNLSSGSTVLSDSLSSIILIFGLTIPMLTMKSFAEENKQKTDQLLLTSPVSIGKIVMGKYLAMISVLGMVIAVCLIFPIIMWRLGDTSVFLDYVTIIAFYLVGCTYISVGMYISSLTENQAIAAVVTFIVIFFSCLADGIGALLSEKASVNWAILAILVVIVVAIVYKNLKNATIATALLVVLEAVLLVLYIAKESLYTGLCDKILSFCNAMLPYYNLSGGMLYVKDLVYYAGMIAFFVFLTSQTIRKRRWN